ncbi:hypothetical protein B5S29_g4492 [[Candida] boidinii]|nr:hypothetical protein B5S29_g4492 [[Candida] boidinii]
MSLAAKKEPETTPTSSIPPKEQSSTTDDLELNSSSIGASTNGSAATEEQIDTFTSEVAHDKDDLPIPRGIEEIDEDELERSTGETINLDLKTANQQVWLVKLPPYIADVWKDEDKLDGRKLGSIKIQKGISPAKILLELNQELEEQKKLPKEFELKIAKQVVDNEFVFSETEFDHFKNRIVESTEMAPMPFQPKLKSLNKEVQLHPATWFRRIRTSERDESTSGIGTTIERRFGNKGKKRFIPYAKTIPKKTSIVGKVAHECQVVPLRSMMTDFNTKMLQQKRKLQQLGAPKKKINFMKNEAVGVLQGAAAPNIHTGATMTLSREIAAKREAAKAEGRASRMERQDLMNKLFDMFGEYEYWTMKGIKEKTNQPEAYLKECLDSIAVLERKGTYALKYRLKDEYKTSREVERKEKLYDDDDIEITGTATHIKREEIDDDDDEDDDDLEMIDIT